MNHAENFRKIILEKLDQERQKMVNDYLVTTVERDITLSNKLKHLVNHVEELIVYYETAPQDEILAQMKMFGDGLLGDDE